MNDQNRVYHIAGKSAAWTVTFSESLCEFSFMWLRPHSCLIKTTSVKEAVTA